MALVTNEKEAPQIGQPVGSRAEIEALGCPTRNIATCSPHTADNAGCKAFGICDRAWRGDRPRNEIVQRISSSGGVRIYHSPCFMIVPKEAMANDNNELYEVIGAEPGDYEHVTTYRSRGSVKRHTQRDPNCNDCAQGKCDAWDDVESLEFECPKFPPAATHPELVKFARKIVARKGGAQMQQRAIKTRLLGNENEPETREAREPEKVPDAAPSEKPRFGRGTRS